MDFKIINITSEEWLNAIGITLFHSLWIGIFLSILAAVIILTTRKTNAAFRYQLLAGSLSLFVLAIGYMFYFTLSQEHNHTNQILQPTNQLVHAGIAAESATKSFLFSSKIDDLMSVWSSYSTQIVLIWFLIILAKGVHLVLGLNTVYYLKRNKIFDAGNIWKEKLHSLAIHLGIHQKIEILQSGIAKVPMVVGHLKPVILIPLGLLNSLSTAEVEAILCHELAHIKRRDYLVNVLQNFIEIIFFFNPAVLWVSKLIKAERENCCDDLALTHVSDRRVYVKALLSCQEFQAATPDFAMALTGKSQLVNRVSRMLFNTKSTLNKMEKTVLTLVMAFVFLCSFVLSNAQDNPKKAPVKKASTSAKNNVKQRKKTQKLTVTTTSTKDLIPFYELVLVDSVYEQDEVGDKEEQVAYAKEEAKYANEQAKYTATEQKIEEKRKLEDQKYIVAQNQYVRDMKQYRLDSIRYEWKSKEQMPVQLNVTPVVPIPIKVDMANPVIINKAKAPITTTTTTRKKISLTDIDENGDDLTTRINKELLKDGLITQTKELSYRLDKDFLYINSIKQSSQVHAKYKAKYLKNIRGAALLYNYDYTDKTTI